MGQPAPGSADTMTARVPASPSLSPGRRLFRAVPQSPALGFRVPVAPGASFSARQAKSTPDLNQAGQNRYEPARIVGGTPSSRASRGASPPPLMSPRESNVRATYPTDASQAASRPYTPYAPNTAVWGPSALRTTSPSSGSAPSSRQSGSGLWPNASSPRVSSTERRSPQWTANAGAFGKGSPAASHKQQQLSHLSSGQLGSQSQSRQGRHGELMSWASQNSMPPQGALQAHTVDKDIRCHSPRQQTSRPTSQTHLQAMSGGQINGMKQPVSVPDNHYEAQMSNLRNSLVQHIHSVQKEITRLQIERQKASGAGPTPSERKLSANIAQANGPAAASASTVAVAHSSPQIMLRGASRDRNGNGRELQSSGSGQVYAGATLTARLSSNEGVRAPAEGEESAAVRIQSIWRGEAARRKSPTSSPSREPGAADFNGGRYLLELQHLMAPQDGSEGSGRPFVAIHHAACRIQRAWKVSRWRRKFIDFSERETGWVGTLDWLQHHNLLYGTELADPEDVRWWCLQRHGAPLDREVDPWGCTKLHDHLNKMWYGRSAEEASVEEVHARAQAEYEAAYWAATERNQRHEQRYDQTLDEPTQVYLHGSDGIDSAREAYLVKSWARDLSSPVLDTRSTLSHGRSAPIGVDLRSYAQGMAVPALRSPVSTDRALDLSGGPIASSIGGAVGSSVPLLRMGAVGIPIGNSMSGSTIQATSLSPRRAATLYDGGDMTSRSSKGKVVGASPPIQGPSPPQTHRATHRDRYQASPPQTHRAARNSTSPVLAVPASPLPGSASMGSASSASAVSNSISSSLRPRSPVTAHRVSQGVGQGRLSLTGKSGAVMTSGLQRPSLGQAPSAGSPPSLVAKGSSGGSQQVLQGLAGRR